MRKPTIIYTQQQEIHLIFFILFNFNTILTPYWSYLRKIVAWFLPKKPKLWTIFSLSKILSPHNHKVAVG